MEFWGDEIDTLCYFDPETQRRTDDPLEEITLAPSTEVLVSSPGSLAKKIERLSAGLRGKTAVRAKERLAQEADQLLAGKRREARTNFAAAVPLAGHPAGLFGAGGPGVPIGAD